MRDPHQLRHAMRSKAERRADRADIIYWIACAFLALGALNLIDMVLS